MYFALNRHGGPNLRHINIRFNLVMNSNDLQLKHDARDYFCADRNNVVESEQIIDFGCTALTCVFMKKYISRSTLISANIISIILHCDVLQSHKNVFHLENQ